LINYDMDREKRWANNKEEWSYHTSDLHRAKRILDERPRFRSSGKLSYTNPEDVENRLKPNR